MKFAKKLSLSLLAASTLVAANAGATTESVVDDFRFAAAVGFSNPIQSYKAVQGESTAKVKNSAASYNFSLAAQYLVYKSPEFQLGLGPVVGFSAGNVNSSYNNYGEEDKDGEQVNARYKEFRVGVSFYAKYNSQTEVAPMAQVAAGYLQTGTQGYVHTLTGPASNVKFPTATFVNGNGYAKASGYYAQVSLGALYKESFFGTVDFTYAKTKTKLEDGTKAKRKTDYRAIGFSIGYSF